MQTLTRILGSALALTATLAWSPAIVSAQQECTAEVLPRQIEVGANAVRLTVSMSQGVGEVQGLDAASAGGITVAALADLPRIELAAGEARAPITSADRENTWTVWVNTTEARPGTHRVTFVGSEGRCTADVTVQAPN